MNTPKQRSFAVASGFVAGGFFCLTVQYFGMEAPPVDFTLGWLHAAVCLGFFAIGLLVKR